MDMLGVMRGASIKGTLTVNGKQMDSKGLAKIAGFPEFEIIPLLKELEEKEVFSRLEDGTIICRRLYREGEISRKRANAGSKGASSRWQTDSRDTEIGDGKPIADIEDEDESEDSLKGGRGGNPKFEARHLDLAKFLEAKVHENVPYHKFTGTNYLESWAREFRLMEERDKIPFSDIRWVLERSLEDEFWRINILSAGTFREKFGRLSAKLSRDNKRAPESPHVGASPKPDKSPAYWAEVRKLKAQGLEGESLTKAIAEIEGRRG